MNQNLANELELVVLSFFQERRGFDEWWHSMDETTQAAVEQNLIDRIAMHPNKTLKADVRSACGRCSPAQKRGDNYCATCGRDLHAV